MTAPARRTTVAYEAIQKLIPEFWGKPRIAAVILALADEVQVAEDAIWDGIEARIIDNAQGIYLRWLGALVGQPNNGAPPWTDDRYRIYIRARIRANRSSGKIRDLLEVAQAVATVRSYRDVGQGTFEITVDSTSTTYLQDVRNVIDSAAAAGVDVRVHAERPDALFILDTIPSSAPAGTGLSTILGTGGGYLSRTAAGFQP